jgi:hypothetical protein
MVVSEEIQIVLEGELVEQSQAAGAVGADIAAGDAHCG